DNNASYSPAMWILVGVKIVVLAVIIAVWFGIKASLVAPMYRLIGSIRQTAGGDLVQPIVVDGSTGMGKRAEIMRQRAAARVRS
ncbi:methyl-accepting chemotaxis protein II, partial [Escherichia coli]|nr:methyl-accepting chemotaxis protein II [Escherichia coli]